MLWIEFCNRVEIHDPMKPCWTTLFAKWSCTHYSYSELKEKAKLMIEQRLGPPVCSLHILYFFTFDISKQAIS